MAIVPGVEPVQGLNQQVKPFQPLPVEQISASTQRLTERLQNTRDEMAALQQEMVSKEVLPANQDKFALATEGVRNRLEKIAQSDQVYNKLSEVKKEAKRFDQITKGFKQNRENIQQTIDSINKSNRSEAQKRALKREVLKRADVQLTDDGQVDPDTISQARSFGDAEDPERFLSERLSKVAEQTFRDRDQVGDKIIETKRSVVLKDRLFNQGLRELGLTISEDASEDGQIRSEDVVFDPSNLPTNPKLRSWIKGRSAVVRQRFQQQFREEGKDPTTEENQRKIDEKVNRAIRDRLVRKIDVVSSREASGDVDPKVTISDAPGASEDSSNIEKATVNPGFQKSTPQAQEKQKVVEDKMLSKEIDRNSNIDSVEEYKRIGDLLKSASSDQIGTTTVSFAGGLGDKGPKTPEEIVKKNENITQETLDAYHNIKKKVTSAKEGATEAQEFSFPSDSKRKNEVETELARQSPEDWEARGEIGKEQLEELLAKESNFTLQQISEDGSHIRLKAGKDIESESTGIFSSFDAVNEGQEVVLRPKRDRVTEGRQVEDPMTALAEFLPEGIKQNMKAHGEIRSLRGDKPFGTQFEPIAENSDIEMKLSDNQTRIHGRLSVSDANVPFNAKVNGDEMTFENFSREVFKSDLSEKQDRQLIGELTKSMTQIPNLREKLGLSATDKLGARQISALIRKWHTDRESIPDRIDMKGLKEVIQSAIPGEKSTTYNLAKTFKSLKQ